MAKTTVNAREILADIKLGMDNTALMEKYQLSEKGLQSLFKKLTDAGVLKPKQGEPEERGSEPDKSVHVAWKCPACGKPQTRQVDECPDCGVIVAKFREAPVKGELDDGPQRKVLEEEKAGEYVWKCSNCGKLQAESFEQCPECHAIGSKVKTPRMPEGRQKALPLVEQKPNWPQTLHAQARDPNKRLQVGYIVFASAITLMTLLYLTVPKQTVPIEEYSKEGLPYVVTRYRETPGCYIVALFGTVSLVGLGIMISELIKAERRWPRLLLYAGLALTLSGVLMYQFSEAIEQFFFNLGFALERGAWGRWETIGTCAIVIGIVSTLPGLYLLAQERLSQKLTKQ
ncbi:MAG: hypothetical protein ACLP5H_13105 [Desulfomonilaceae bacterium]